MDKKKNDSLVLEIAETIQRHRKLETSKIRRPDKNLAIALSNVYYFGSNKRIWITNKENNGGHRVVKDITGAGVQTYVGGPTTLVTDGFVASKNSRFGEVLIKNHKGKHEIKTPRGLQPIEIFNFCSYLPDPHSSNAKDLMFHINEAKPRTYESLNKILNKVVETNKDIESLEDEVSKKETSRKAEDDKITELERELALAKEKKEAEALEKRKQELLQKKEEEDRAIIELTSDIESKRKEKEQSLKDAENFIRKNAEMRYQPILDPWQEEIKRSNIFNSTVAIDGGPGTGKTTALIQRIKFLIDRDAMLGSDAGNDELASLGYMPNMTSNQKKKLFNNPNNWVFFTPNELLKLFLKNSMIQEGLNANDDRVLIWEDYLTVLVKKYKLINPETKNPFLILRKHSDKNILPYNGKQLSVILKEFEKFFLKNLNDSVNKVAKIDVSTFKWKNKGKSIQNYINRQEKDYSLEGIIKLYFNIQDNFGAEVKELTKEYNNLLKNVAAKIIIEIKKHDEVNSKLYEFVEDWKKQSQNNIDEDNIEDDDIELEEDSTDSEAYLFGKLKILVKNKSLSVYDKSVKINKRYKELLEIVETVLSLDKLESYDRIGQLGFFNKYFVRISRGIVSNIISEIPKQYKKFRKEELSLQKNKWNYKILKYIVEEDKSKNKRIHPNEQALLIYFINSVIKKSYKVSKLKSSKISHSYFEAYKENMVPVIGIDEATDFHIIDLLAIHSLSDIEISSVTFSGDIMQRLTDQGIRKWEELKLFIKPFEEKKLEISYRQSPTLLDVATAIYNRATNSEAEYISFMDKDEREPKPILYINDDEYEKIEWISERILEIYKAYGNWIPSIAIFLPDENDLEQFATQLGEIDDLADVGIKVRPSNKGQVLGDSNTVRVFSIKYIKGMEFEAVFFHNIHKVAANYQSEEMLMKNLYVGLSRASFYMAITSDEDVEEIGFLEDIFETEETNWHQD